MTTQTHDIKVGDIVRLTGEDWSRVYRFSTGDLYEVDDVERAGHIWAGKAGAVGNGNGLYSADNPEDSGDFSVELVSRAGQAGTTERIINRDPVDPDHYKFPGGAEVIHISQWLTANAAQAVQYICRSSRIDGKNKGDAVEDIEKAIRFLTFEKERLK